MTEPQYSVRVFDQCDQCSTIAMCYAVGPPGDRTLLCPDCYADLMDERETYYEYDDEQDV